MKCHILFSEKNKKNISKCRLLKILPRVLSVKSYQDAGRVIMKAWCSEAQSVVQSYGKCPKISNT